MQSKNQNSDVGIWILACFVMSAIAFAVFPALLLACAIVSLIRSKGWLSLATRVIGLAIAIGTAAYYADDAMWFYERLSVYSFGDLFKSYFPHETALEALKLWGLINGVGLVAVLVSYFASGGSITEVRSTFAWGGNRKPRKQTTEGMQLENWTSRKVAKHWAKPGTKPRPVSLGLVPFPSVKTETLHTVVEGATGSGKTQALKTLVAAALERGDSVIAIDGGADLYNAFKDQADNVSRFDLMDGYDLGWWPSNEIERKADWKQVAQGFFGDGKGDSAEWV